MLPDFKNLDDVTRLLKKMGRRVSEMLELLQLNKQQMVEAGMRLQITPDGVTTGGSGVSIDTEPAETIRVKNMDALRSKYRVLTELFQSKTELDAMEAKLKVNFAKQNPERALAEINRMRKTVLAGISDGFAFLQTTAKQHMPRKLDLLSKGMVSALEKSLMYTSGTMYSYVFVDDAGDLCFTKYLHLKELEDESGRMFPELFITMSYRTGADAATFVGVQHNFTPPSDDLLMRRVKSIKDALTAVSTMLELDSFDNTIGSLPLDVLLSPKAIQKNLFSYAAQVQSLDVDEHSIVFNLKSTAAEKVAEIASQLYKELNGIQRRTNARLRMAVQRDKKPTIHFKFVPMKNAAPITPDDLEFMKLRFGVSNEELKKISRIINIGG